ncbi:hypothetical protein BKA69DRAFT_1127195 [Paraphysoderma sedebokerense]|nr:hypothetical protein BKA69DRAFT_1127195 [Paraphysoderma sedebokerense]
MTAKTRFIHLSLRPTLQLRSSTRPLVSIPTQVCFSTKQTNDINLYPTDNLDPDIPINPHYPSEKVVSGPETQPTLAPSVLINEKGGGRGNLKEVTPQAQSTDNDVIHEESRENSNFDLTLSSTGEYIPELDELPSPTSGSFQADSASPSANASSKQPEASEQPSTSTSIFHRLSNLVSKSIDQTLHSKQFHTSASVRRSSADDDTKCRESSYSGYGNSNSGFDYEKGPVSNTEKVFSHREERKREKSSKPSDPTSAAFSGYGNSNSGVQIQPKRKTHTQSMEAFATASQESESSTSGSTYGHRGHVKFHQLTELTRNFLPKELKRDLTTTFVSDTAKLEGDISIGPLSSIFHHAVLRADMNKIEIGKSTNIQDGTVIHATKVHPTFNRVPTVVTVGANVSISHNCTVHGSTIQSNVFIGPNSALLDGSEISSNSIVTAGSIVTPDSKFPENSLISGSPAQVVRELTKQEVEQVVLKRAEVGVDVSRDHKILQEKKRLEQMGERVTSE